MSWYDPPDPMEPPEDEDGEWRPVTLEDLDEVQELWAAEILESWLELAAAA